jgi:hypothetical protein
MPHHGGGVGCPPALCARACPQRPLCALACLTTRAALQVLIMLSSVLLPGKQPVVSVQVAGETVTSIDTLKPKQRMEAHELQKQVWAVRLWAGVRDLWACGWSQQGLCEGAKQQACGAGLLSQNDGAHTAHLLTTPPAPHTHTLDTRHATPRHAPPRRAAPRRAAPRHATPRHATPRHATPRHATPRHATPRHATDLYRAGGHAAARA